MLDARQRLQLVGLCRLSPFGRADMLSVMWIAAQCPGSAAPTSVVIAEPQSPPWAT